MNKTINQEPEDYGLWVVGQMPSSAHKDLKILICKIYSYLRFTINKQIVNCCVNTCVFACSVYIFSLVSSSL